MCFFSLSEQGFPLVFLCFLSLCLLVLLCLKSVLAELTKLAWYVSSHVYLNGVFLWCSCGCVWCLFHHVSTWSLSSLSWPNWPGKCLFSPFACSSHGLRRFAGVSWCIFVSVCWYLCVFPGDLWCLLAYFHVFCSQCFLLFPMTTDAPKVLKIVTRYLITVCLGITTHGFIILSIIYSVVTRKLPFR